MAHAFPGHWPSWKVKTTKKTFPGQFILPFQRLHSGSVISAPWPAPFSVSASSLQTKDIYVYPHKYEIYRLKLLKIKPDIAMNFLFPFLHWPGSRN